MNRQIRRIEEKKERQQEREKAKAEAKRQARRRERTRARNRGADAGAKPEARDGAKAPSGGGARRGADPGRFSGALAVASLFFIVLQAVTPSDGAVTTQIVAAAFYLLFGYFAVLWLLRRGTERPIVPAIGIGVALGVGTALSQWLQPGLEPALIMLALIVPFLVAGAFLGRLVWTNAPR